MSKFTVHYTIAATGEVLSKTVDAKTPDEARRLVAEALKPVVVHSRKIKAKKG